jgi:hypothetical protein
MRKIVKIISSITISVSLILSLNLVQAQAKRKALLQKVKNKYVVVNIDKKKVIKIKNQRFLTKMYSDLKGQLNGRVFYELASSSHYDWISSEGKDFYSKIYSLIEKNKTELTGKEVLDTINEYTTFVNDNKSNLSSYELNMFKENEKNLKTVIQAQLDYANCEKIFDYDKYEKASNGKGEFTRLYVSSYTFANWDKVEKAALNDARSDGSSITWRKN